jgi:biotin carboxyl carrier protein
MPGSIIAIHVKEGDSVTANQPLLVLEAMKMEHVLPAPHGGSVASLSVAVGDVVSGGQKLIEISQTP